MAAKDGKRHVANNYVSPLWLLTVTLLYSILIILSWVVTVILIYRPLNYPFWPTSFSQLTHYRCAYIEDGGPSSRYYCGPTEDYTPQSSDESELPISPGSMAFNDNVRVAVRVLNYVGALLALPITSAICARGAVVYVQKSRKISLRHTIALADHSWTNPASYWPAIRRPRWARSHGAIPHFSLCATCLCILGAIPWPLQGVLVTEQPTSVITLDSSVGETQPDQEWFDADITGLSQVPLSVVVQNVVSALASGSAFDNQAQLWVSAQGKCQPNLLWYQECHYGYVPEYHDYETTIVPIQGNDTFVSAMSFNIDTQMAVNHGFRLNSSITCEEVSSSDYPQSCNESGSFQAVSNSNIADETTNFGFRVCAPRNDPGFPWDISTRNRQDINETVYFQFNTYAAQQIFENGTAQAVSVRCNSGTTAGYFELPSSTQNDLTTGPLLEEFNLTASYASSTDLTQGNQYGNTSFILGDPRFLPNISSDPISGPLFTSILALFGSDTWFALRANVTDAGHAGASNDSLDTNNCPLANVAPLGDIFPDIHQYQNISQIASEDLLGFPRCSANDPSYFYSELKSWFQLAFYEDVFEGISTDNIAGTLNIAIFYANQAALQKAAATQYWSRIVVSIPGEQIQKLHASPGVIALLTVLYGVYVFGLVAMTMYARSTATWTDSLDGFAMFRLGASFQRRGATCVPALVRTDTSDVENLDEVSTWLDWKGDPEAGLVVDVVDEIQPKVRADHDRSSQYRLSRHSSIQARPELHDIESNEGPIELQRLWNEPAQPRDFPPSAYMHDNR